MRDARNGYVADGTLTPERQALLGQITARVDTAFEKQRIKAKVQNPQLEGYAPRKFAVDGSRLDNPSSPAKLSSVEAEMRMRITKSTLQGDKAIADAVSALAAKDYDSAHRNINVAREKFREAGEEVENDREMTLGNLYGNILAEQERCAAAG